MLPSFLTVLLWAYTVVCASRAAKLLGSVLANLLRLSLAGVFLALWAHLFGQGLHGRSLPYFILSGCVGFGIGDIAAFEAMACLGPRLTALLAQCLAAPIAAAIEWQWLGTELSHGEIVWGLVILAGVAVALAPRDHLHLPRRQLIAGVLFGLLAALGQGSGAVLSRKAYQVGAATGLVVDGGTAAYQRAIGGLGIVLAFFVFLKWRERKSYRKPAGKRDWRRAWPWVVAHALTGPTVGVSCYQWALATTPSGIVLPIIATTPLAVIPFAYFMDGDRPSPRSLIGGAIAVAGAVALTLVQ